MTRALAAVLVIAAAGVAAAAPPSIKLTRRQIAAAAKAARARVKIDKAKKCNWIPDEDDDPVQSQLDHANCYRDAGALGMATAMWNKLVKDDPTTKQAIEAAGQLGPAFEAIGSFAEAAQAYQAYAKAYPRGAGARDQLVRAICTWEQLGRDDYAAANLELLVRVWPRPVVDSDHLCDTIRPIQPPAP